ncbi:MAG TPA: transcription antitermination factor NusB [Bryobacteraceae bacterium]
MISAARQVAFDVLEAVSAGAYASDSLRFLSKGADARDAGLAGQIVFGCLRYQSQLDYLIETYSGRKTKDLDSDILLALRAAIFQLRYLDRIPAYAAVDDSVELVKRRKRSAAGLTNAVLRKMTRAGTPKVTWPDAATELSCPAWLLERWERHFGSAAARAIASAALLEPPPYMRVPPGAPLPQGLELEATNVAGCYRVLSEAGHGLRLHDISSQSIIPLLDLRPGLSYLDLCAAPGNKTLQALETPLGLAIACDISFRRLREVPPVCPRVALDASEPLPFSILFDRIFIDAPCSGTGTLARNPEIKWRIKDFDWPRFAAKQLRLAQNAARCLAPGGKLVYATCSLEQEENEDVVRALLEGHPELRLDREVWRLPGRDEGDGFYAAIMERN